MRPTETRRSERNHGRSADLGLDALAQGVDAVVDVFTGTDEDRYRSADDGPLGGVHVEIISVRPTAASPSLPVTSSAEIASGS